MTTTARAAAVVLGIAGAIAMNVLAVALPLAGRDTAAVSDMYPVRFTPAGYVFAIWSVIYVGLIAFAVWQAMPAQRSDPAVRRLDGPVLLGCAANAVWLVAWHNLWIPASLAIMLVLLGSLVVTYLRLGTGVRPARSAGERWCARLPFSVYLGWISVATIANTSIVLYHLGWRGAPLSEPVWAAILLVVAAGLALTMARRHADAAYPLVIAWAAYGIAVKQADAAVVVYAAWAVTAVALAAAVWAIAAGDGARMRAV